MAKTEKQYYLVFWRDAHAEHSVYLSEALRKDTNLVVQETVGQFVKLSETECTIMTSRCGDEADIITIPTKQILMVRPLSELAEVKLEKVIVNE